MFRNDSSRSLANEKATAPAGCQPVAACSGRARHGQFRLQQDKQMIVRSSRYMRPLHILQLHTIDHTSTACIDFSRTALHTLRRVTRSLLCATRKRNDNPRHAGRADDRCSQSRVASSYRTSTATVKPYRSIFVYIIHITPRDDKTSQDHGCFFLKINTSMNVATDELSGSYCCSCR